jgi:hypothetical protein
MGARRLGGPSAPTAPPGDRRGAGTSPRRSTKEVIQLANLTLSTLAEVIAQAHRGIDRVRRTPHLAYSFLRHAGLSVS